MENRKIIVVMLLSMMSGITRPDQSEWAQSGIVVPTKALIGGIALTGGALWYLKGRSDRLAEQQQEKYRIWAQREDEKRSDHFKNVGYGFLDVLSSYTFNGSPLFATAKVAMRSFLLWFKNKELEPVEMDSQLKQSVACANFTDFSSCIVPGYFASSKCDPNEIVDGAPTIHRIFDRFSADRPDRMRWMECLTKNKSVNWNAKNHNGCTLLHRAITVGDTDLVRLLKQHGAKSDVGITQGNVSGATALHLVSEVEDQHKRRQIVSELLQGLQVDMEVRLEKGGHTPLAIAALLKRDDLVKTYLNCGASIQAQNDHGETPLFIAVKSGCRNSVVELLSRDNGRTINKKNRQGDTPLCWAIRNKEYWMVRALKAVGTIDFQLSGEGGKTPVQLLLDNADENSLDILSALRVESIHDAKMLFDAVVQNKKYSSAQFLFNVFLTDEERREVEDTTLVEAIKKGDATLVQSLLACEEIDCDFVDELFRAAKSGHQSVYDIIYRAMQDFSIDTDMKNDSGETAQQVLNRVQLDKAREADRARPWYKIW